jgi:hypothetical protein
MYGASNFFYESAQGTLWLLLRRYLRAVQATTNRTQVRFQPPPLLLWPLVLPPPARHSASRCFSRQQFIHTNRRVHLFIMEVERKSYTFGRKAGPRGVVALAAVLAVAVFTGRLSFHVQGKSDVVMPGRENRTVSYSSFPKACDNNVIWVSREDANFRALRPYSVELGPLQNFTNFSRCVGVGRGGCGSGSTISTTMPGSSFGSRERIVAQADGGTDGVVWSLRVNQISPETNTLYRTIEISTRLGAAGITSRQNIGKCEDVHTCEIFDEDRIYAEFCCVIVGASCKIWTSSSQGASAIVTSPERSTITTNQCSFFRPPLPLPAVACQETSRDKASV